MNGCITGVCVTYQLNIHSTMFVAKLLSSSSEEVVNSVLKPIAIRGTYTILDTNQVLNGKLTISAYALIFWKALTDKEFASYHGLSNLNLGSIEDDQINAIIEQYWDFDGLIYEWITEFIQSPFFDHQDEWFCFMSDEEVDMLYLSPELITEMVVSNHLYKFISDNKIAFSGVGLPKITPEFAGSIL